MTRKTTQTPTFPTPYAPRNCNNKTTFLRYTRTCNSPIHSAHTHLRGATETHLVDMVVGLHKQIIVFVWQDSDPAECYRAHNKLI